jgi:type VI secretion system secreted protein VgrG
VSTTTYTQTGRPMTITTPLGADVLLMVGFTGRESISQIFEYHLDVIATNYTDIPFDKILAQKVTINLELPEGEKRHFNGIVRRFSQGHRDDTFTYYRIEVVPKFWLLRKRVQSRIFQQKTVVEILKDVLQGLDVSYQIQGTFAPREYCVQYRETDFNFVSRLMEEEGIYYFFKHSDGRHEMVLGNTAQSHPDLPNYPNLIYEQMAGGNRLEDRVHTWERMQELRSGKITLWDHCFELPHKHLESEKPVPETVKVGKLEHKLKLADTGTLEIYDYPGGYAKRFDGVNKSGGDQPAQLQKVFQDNSRTTGIRMQEEAASSVAVHAFSNCRQLSAGHKFVLQRHFNADGKYLLTSIEHTATLSPHYRSGGIGEFNYSNAFTCIPSDLPFRPPRVVPTPRVDGCQTAVVVGPPGEEIFTDKYGRVKVQFHWDRSGKNDAESSCWVRVVTAWAGKQWGIIHIPRVGQEVVVDFLEGDPDRPLIVGSVYNAEMMPPYGLPADKTQSGIKTRSCKAGGPDNFNEIRFEDKKGSEQLFVHAEKDSRFETEHDRSEWVGHDEEVKVDNDRNRNVGKNEKVKIGENQTESVGKKRAIDVGTDDSLDVGQKITVKAGDEITLQTGASKIVMKKDGTIEISGVSITVDGKKSIENKGVLITSEASGVHTIKGSLVKIN